MVEDTLLPWNPLNLTRFRYFLQVVVPYLLSGRPNSARPPEVHTPDHIPHHIVLTPYWIRHCHGKITLVHSYLLGVVYTPPDRSGSGRDFFAACLPSL